MRYLVTGSQMRAIDQDTIQNIGIPSLMLMERAAECVARKAEQLCDQKTLQILAICGVGNNGADGVAAARMLYLHGFDVLVVVVGNEAHATKEFEVQKGIAEKLEIPVVDWEHFLHGEDEQKAGDRAIIDAVFGVGLSRDVEGTYAEVLDWINKAETEWVLAVDMPSGIHSDTGAVMGTAVKADVTVTFGYEKMGSALYPGRGYCGQTEVCDIGFPELSRKKAGAEQFTYDPEDLNRIPARPAYSNKGTFGKVLVVAGSADMSGAAYLCAKAAYSMGAGLVKIMTPQENRQILQTLLPEAILSSYRNGQEPENLEKLSSQVEKNCGWADVIVLGPGMGQGSTAKFLVQEFLSNAYVPMIIDADGLNIIASDPDLTGFYTENLILTPHLGEMARLTGKTVPEIQEDLPSCGAQYSSDSGVICVLKDAATVVTGRDGQCYVNSSGNSAMAKAGSGDVLSGTIAGLLALGMENWDAAVLGVYIHGTAGDRVLEKKGSHGLLARDLTEEIAAITTEIEKDEPVREHCAIEDRICFRRK